MLRAWWWLAAPMLRLGATICAGVGYKPVFVVGDVADLWTLFSMAQCPRIQSARCIDFAWCTRRSVIAQTGLGGEGLGSSRRRRRICIA